MNDDGRRPLEYTRLVEQARSVVREVDPAEVEVDAGVVLLDVREPEEHAQGAIPGAIAIPRGVLEGTVANHVPNPDTPIVLYCSAGHRSVLAAKALQEMGYTGTASMRGGFDRWKAEGRPWEVPQTLSLDQRARYSRHLTLPEVGEEGQAKLLDARVLLIGAGGLGSPVALYLAAAGIGTLGIVDSDVVDATNLQRQILHTLDRVGHRKVASARETIRALNPDVKVETYDERLTAANALDIMRGYDVVVDGADNFPTRYLVNDASLHLGVPVVHGSILRFEGQATVFSPHAGPCYRCLFPLPPPAELAPSCAEAGVLGVLPGVVGSIQAMEAIKLVLGIGEPLVGRLLTYDALEEDFTTLRFSRVADCVACADPDRPPRLVDYDAACAPGGTVARTS